MKITKAQEVRASMDTKDFEYACDCVMNAIIRASKEGYRDTCFNPPGGNKYYYAVKEEFQKHGYTFRPTGSIGGVRQDSEQICW